MFSARLSSSHLETPVFPSVGMGLSLETRLAMTEILLMEMDVAVPVESSRATSVSVNRLSVHCFSAEMVSFQHRSGKIVMTQMLPMDTGVTQAVRSKMDILVLDFPPSAH